MTGSRLLVGRALFLVVLGLMWWVTLPRFIKVEEAAAMVHFMVSSENSFTTGATFDLSGGRTTY